MEITDVLIVEDLVEVSTWLQSRIAQSFGAVNVNVAASLAAANAALAHTQWTLVLLDLGLPDGDGTSLIREIKAKTPSCFCIVTTIFDDSDHIFPALSAGADGYLLKDEEDEVFSHNLAGILAGRPPLSSSIANQVLASFRRPIIPATTPLTPREEDVLVLIAKGYSCKNAAVALGVSYYTAAGYLKSVYQKLQVNTRAEATLKAVELGIISTSDTP
jgi:DNA-binding NarL/FixJ family response regulator